MRLSSKQLALSYDLLETVYTSLKTSRYVNVTYNQLANELLETYSIREDDQPLVVNAAKNFINRRKAGIKSGVNAEVAENFGVVNTEYDMNEEDINLAEIEDENRDLGACAEAAVPAPVQNRNSAPLLEVGDRQQKRRLKPVMDYLTDFCRQEQCTMNELFGLLIKQVNYVHDRDIAKIGDHLVAGQDKSLMDMTTVSHLQQNLQLGRGK